MEELLDAHHDNRVRDFLDQSRSIVSFVAFGNVRRWHRVHRLSGGTNRLRRQRVQFEDDGEG